MTDAKQLIDAARNADWMQVVLNGGPPCFHLSDDGPGCPARFCLRAERWAGHVVMHAYTPLHELVARAAGVAVGGAPAADHDPVAEWEREQSARTDRWVRENVLAQVLDALRIGRVACEWAGHQQDAEKIAAAMDAARTLAHGVPVAPDQTFPPEPLMPGKDEPK